MCLYCGRASSFHHIVMEKCQENVLGKEKDLKKNIYIYITCLVFFAAVRTGPWFNSWFREFVLHPTTCVTICNAKCHRQSELGVVVWPSLLWRGREASSLLQISPTRAERLKHFNIFLWKVHISKVVFFFFNFVSSSPLPQPPSTNRQTWYQISRGDKNAS